MPDLPIDGAALSVAVSTIVVLVAGIDLGVAAIMRAVSESTPDD